MNLSKRMKRVLREAAKPRPEPVPTPITDRLVRELAKNMSEPYRFQQMAELSKCLERSSELLRGRHEHRLRVGWKLAQCLELARQHGYHGGTAVLAEWAAVAGTPPNNVLGSTELSFTRKP